MKNLKEKFRGMGKNARVFLFLFIFMIVGVSAVWVLSFNSGMTGMVISGGAEIEFVDTFSLTNFVSNSSEFNETQYINITNSDGDRSATLNFVETRTDVSDGCTDYETDVSFEVALDNIPKSDGAVITIPSGNSTISVLTYGKPFSCPQTASLELTISE